LIDNVLRIYVGYDPSESIAWHTFVHSVLSRSSQPVAIVPINLVNLRKIFTRERDSKQSNEFSFTRFLVPYLSGYNGQAAFFDCDMLLRTDVAELFAYAQSDPSKAVHVVKHDYKPRDEVKYLNTRQYNYPRRLVFCGTLDCCHPSNRKVTPEFVNSATAMELHRFQWLEDEEIGSLDIRWNWLVGEYDQPPNDVKNVHWTVGGPYFNEYRNVDFAEEWFSENEKVNFCLQRERIGR